MLYKCPVCYWPAMDVPPCEYAICECCGTEFGADDDGITHAELRKCWIAEGCSWFFGKEPANWDPQEQLQTGM